LSQKHLFGGCVGDTFWGNKIKKRELRGTAKKQRFWSLKEEREKRNDSTTAGSQDGGRRRAIRTPKGDALTKSGGIQKKRSQKNKKPVGVVFFLPNHTVS